MAQFVQSSMNYETLPFAFHIDKFSLRARKGYYETPAFRSKVSDSKWSLVVYANDEYNYGDLFDIRLRRYESDGRDQFAEVKMTVVNCLGFGGLQVEKKLSFTRSNDTHKVLSVTMSDIKKPFYLPDDTLTVQGEVVVYDETRRSFESQEDFKKRLKHSHFAFLAVVSLIFWKLLTFCAKIIWAVLRAAPSVISWGFKHVINELRPSQTEVKKKGKYIPRHGYVVHHYPTKNNF